MNFNNIFKVEDWEARGQSVLNELLVMIACSSLVSFVLLSFGIGDNLAPKSISLAALIVWFIYVSSYPHIVNEKTGMENEEMIIMRCVKFRHAFYKCAQSAATLYAIVWVLMYCKSVII